MSVGEALGLPPEQDDATNLAEVHALASTRKAAQRHKGGHGKHKRKRKKHRRARSLTPTPTPRAT